MASPARQNVGQREKIMLKQFFTQPKVLRRLQEGVFGPYLPAFAVSLQQEGYSKGCIRRHLRAADRFGAWLSQQKLTLSDLTRALVKRYIEGRGPVVFCFQTQRSFAAQRSGSA
jgi:hypothetical protein